VPLHPPSTTTNVRLNKRRKGFSGVKQPDSAVVAANSKKMFDVWVALNASHAGVEPKSPLDNNGRSASYATHLLLVIIGCSNPCLISHTLSRRSSPPRSGRSEFANSSRVWYACTRIDDIGIPIIPSDAPRLVGVGNPGIHGCQLTSLIRFEQCQIAVRERHDQRTSGTVSTDFRLQNQGQCAASPYLVGALLLDQSRDRHKTSEGATRRVPALHSSFYAGWAENEKTDWIVGESIRNLLEIPFKQIHASLGICHCQQRLTTRRCVTPGNCSISFTRQKEPLTI
jgi:hypothetical protein